MFLYSLLAGLDYPIIRGFLLGSITLLSENLGAMKLNSFRVLLWLWVLISLLSPFSPFNWSFIMSFIATFTLVSLPKFKGKISEIFLTSLWIWLSILPITLLIFHRVSLLAPLSNSVALPVVSLIVPAGVIWIIIGNLHLSILALPLRVIVKTSLRFIIETAKAFSSFSITIPQVPTSLSLLMQTITFLYVAILIWVLWVLSLERDEKLIERLKR